jgi:hypothetical protein
MRVMFPYSHAFSGGRVEVQDDGADGPSCVVEFADGTIVIGEVLGIDAGRYQLLVPAYITASGSLVQQRRWVLERRREERGWRSLAS